MHTRSKPLPEHRGFGTVPCPHCGRFNKLVVLINDVGYMSCRRCKREVYPKDIEELIAECQAFLAWLKTAPSAQAQGEQPGAVLQSGPQAG